MTYQGVNPIPAETIESNLEENNYSLLDTLSTDGQFEELRQSNVSIEREIAII